MYPEKNILRARLRFHQVRLVTFSCLPLLLAACGTVTPVSLTQAEIKDRVPADSKAIYADQEPVTKQIKGKTATAHALKYNLDYRLKLWEKESSKNLKARERYEMRKRLVAGEG